jgi:LacI family transcriptional regulator
VKKKVNIKALAAELNLSVATISKALRDSHEISKETKEKVLALAQQLNYTPNPYASSLRKNKSNTIAVVLPEVADNFFSLAINGIQAVAEKKGYHVLIYLSHDKYNNEKNILEDCRSGRVDGVLISISSETINANHIKQLQADNIPIVFFDREHEGVETASVITNDFDCGLLATQHLLAKGSKKPAFFSLSGSLPICKAREEGYRKALADAKPKKITPAVVYCPTNDEVNYLALKKIIAGKKRPDGIVAAVERIAMQVYLVCHELNVRIPEDMKVIAFSTVETAPILNPSLTTITQPAFDIGHTAATLLFKGIEKQQFDLKKERVIIPSELIERKSTS